ncbi:MAG: hypothetical protein Greene071421_103 [Parcubacteria group bacterium Greene0714_21]|nr:MAG: hypothetical protein Greene041639_248 [Parcubacteria group bacterium Greene0416_39]TSC98505.1 MAG: hypothetical protein Greene101447_7 [Parcubacteria group bacterium Greene1014_47]TSD04267.1 MAG: hypothetical protein Greene071421_103 [Parcubacteria group bacterium Greene0714_21]
MPNWQGKKSGGTHTTLIDAAEPLVKAAEKLPEVTKIVLGFIKATPGKKGKRRVKFTITRSGFLMIVRGNTSVQEIRIYTDSPKEVKQNLEKVRL